MGTSIPNRHSHRGIIMNFIKNNSYLLVVLVLCIAFAFIGVSKYSKEQAYSEITITEGDTLWELAYHYSGKESPGKWVTNVMKINNLPSSTIRSGDSLLLPKQITTPFDTQMAGVDE